MTKYAEGRLVCGECEYDKCYTIRLNKGDAEKAHTTQLKEVIYPLMAQHPHTLTLMTHQATLIEKIEFEHNV